MYGTMWIFIIFGVYHGQVEGQFELESTSTSVMEGTSQNQNETDDWIEEEISIDDIDWGSDPRECAIKIYFTYRHLFDEVDNDLIKCMCFQYCEDTSSSEKERILKGLVKDLAATRADDDIPIMVTYISVMVVGALGNILVLVTVIWIFKAANVTNMFICSLAVADFIVVTVCIPFRILDYVGDGIWDLGEETCKFFVYLYFTSFMFSVFVLTAMSLERYMVICHPMKASSRSTPGRARKVIFATLIAALVFASPSAYTSGMDLFECQTVKGEWAEDWRGPLYIYMSVAVFAIPSFIMGYAYISVGLALWKSIKAANAMKGGDEKEKTKAKEQSASIRGRIQVIRMLVMIWIVFFFAWGPYLIFNAFISYDHLLDWKTTGDQDTILIQTFNILTMANSAINPVLYAFMSKQFRRGFLKVFLCVPFIKRRYVTETTSSAVTGSSAVRSTTVASSSGATRNGNTSVNPST